MKKKKIAFVLGIRPDIIRASLILEYLNKSKKVETLFIWSGQHYSDNMKDVFFRELKVKKPDIDLKCAGRDDADTVSQVISRLYKVLEKETPDAIVFLGDNNTVTSCIAAAQLNIPIFHIEGCMRSYDWRMPEEKYRSLIDHLSDVIYVYMEEYKQQGVREGINPKNILVVGNPIVDILERFYFKRKEYFAKRANNSFFKKRGLQKNNYYLMTCHRRENVHNPDSFKSIIKLIEQSSNQVYFPASYRTQKIIKEMGIKLSSKITVVDPIGYEEFLILMVNSVGVITDSGTVVEEACVLGIPSLQMRKSTERPQVYDVGSSVKFDPANAKKYPANKIFKKLKSLSGKKWKHNLGDGKTSERIARDLIKRVTNDNVRGHLVKNYHIPTKRSYREDGIKI